MENLINRKMCFFKLVSHPPYALDIECHTCHVLCSLGSRLPTAVTNRLDVRTGIHVRIAEVQVWRRRVASAAGCMTCLRTGEDAVRAVTTPSIAFSVYLAKMFSLSHIFTVELRARSNAHASLWIRVCDGVIMHRDAVRSAKCAFAHGAKDLRNPAVGRYVLSHRRRHLCSTI